MIFAANFKMNHTRRSTAEYLERLDAKLENAKLDDNEFIVFPPASALCPSAPNIKIGAQNAYMAEKGAYTGETGAEQLAEFGIDTILIGHSERRSICGEKQDFIAKKFDFFAGKGFRIIYCIGEPLETREKGQKAVEAYLQEQFDGIDTGYGKLVVAYEPVWAIGTGRSAKEEEIGSVHAELRRRGDFPILYGGSVNDGNITSILSVENVDGVLVGSASLDPESFFSMISRGVEV